MIYCILAVNGKQSKIPMGLKVNAWQWNKQRQQCTIAANMTDNDRANNMAVNGKLNAVRGMYEDYFTYLCNIEDETTPTEIEQEIRERINNIVGNGNGNDMGRPKKQVSKKNAGVFAEQLQGLISDFSKGRQAKYIKVVNGLLDYMNKKNIPQQWLSITPKMLYNFMAWMVTQKPMQIRYYNDTIMNIYAILDHADNNNYLDGNRYDKTKWLKVFGKMKDIRNAEERQSVYIVLENEQLEKLSQHDFKDGLKNEVRDIFTFLCNTGLAVGDFLQIWSNDFATWLDDNNVEIKRNKNSRPCTIPMHRVKELYSRYSNGFPFTKIKGKYEDGKLKLKTEENRLLNDTLHAICKEIGFNDSVEVVRTFVGCNDGRIELTTATEMKPLHEEITMYDSRHTFITIAYYMGMDKQQLADIVGHASTKMIDRIYLKLDQEKERAAKVERNNRFYNGGASVSTKSSTDSETANVNKIADQAITIHEQQKKIASQRQMIASQRQMIAIEQQRREIEQQKHKELKEAVNMGMGEAYKESQEDADKIADITE